jgi:hypothetical protein
MSGPTSSELDRWADAFDSAWNDPQIVSNLKCPTCSAEGELHLLYVLDDVEASHGMFAFWCAVCLTGFPPGIGMVPEGAQRFRRGEESVPNYRLAVDR